MRRTSVLPRAKPWFGAIQLPQTGWKQGSRKKAPAFAGRGQNARLAAKLTGWKIDIKPVSAPSDEEPEDEEDVLLDDGAETEE